MVVERARDTKMQRIECFNVGLGIALSRPITMPDLVLNFQDRDTSLSILKDKHVHVVFRVIVIELGLVHYWLYAGAMAILNPWGFTLRAVSILFTGMVLVIFIKKTSNIF